MPLYSKFLSVFLPAVCCALLACSQSDVSYDSMRREFENPDQRFAGAPFFSLNDKLDPDEIRWQLGQMHEQGLGGAFLHPRNGMITEYLSDEYFDMYGAAIDEGKRLGFDIWLYDEDGWPSGSAGGRVMKLGPEYVIKTLMCTELSAAAVDSLLDDPDTIAIYKAEMRGDALNSFERLSLSDLPVKDKDAVYLRAWVYYGRYGTLTDWYVDLLEPKAVDAFMQMTHEQFKKRFSADFGGIVPGIFSDEPNYSFLPWTGSFPGLFEERNGYDITAKLPLLYYRGEGFEKARYDYYRTMTDRFVETFTERIYNWCDDNNLTFTGHVLHEDNLYVQTAHVGAAMPHYEFMHMPGVDHLSRDIADPLLVKQVSSVAHQLGKKRVLSELYGTSGWNASFEDLKLLGEWQYVLGVNFPCQHLSHYSLRGVRKQDFPPSLHYHQPWWPHYNYYNRYTARLLSMLVRGGHECGILVLHPIESAWILTDPTDNTQYRWNAFVRLYKGSEVARINSEFAELSHNLLAVRHDYDYGDERIISRHGSVENGRFRIGEQEYGTVIVPSCLILRSSTFELLRDFRKQGGTVLSAGTAPVLLDGERSDELAAFFADVEKVDNKRDALRETLDKSDSRSFSLRALDGSEADSLYVQERRIGNDRLYYLVNISRFKPVSVALELSGNGVLEEWNPSDGSVNVIPVDIHSGGLAAEFDFAPVQSKLLLFRPGADMPSEMPGKMKTLSKTTLPDTWQFTRNHPNALPLDFCSYRTGSNKAWSETMPVLTALKEVRALGRDVTVTLEYSFDSNTAMLPDAELVLETPGRFTISVNGSDFVFEDCGYYWDRTFRKAPVGRYLRRGENTIELAMDFKGAPGEKFPDEFDAIYLIGSFAVIERDGGGFSLTEEASGNKQSGDIAAYGYPFYPGSITYSQTVDMHTPADGGRVYLSCDSLDASVADVRINGVHAGYFSWRPYICVIGEYLKDGENTIEIELFTSLRNLLGPLHHSDIDPHFTGPWHFGDMDDPGAYNTVRYGLSGAVRIEIRE